MQGAADHFQALPALEEVPTPFYRENGWPVALPADHYSSTTFASKLIGYMQENAGSGRPFFGVLSFTAPHWPLQAPDVFLERYRDRYLNGYEPIRAARLMRQRSLGIIDETIRPAPPVSAVWPSWQQLSPVTRDLEARRMQVYAAMIEALDHEVGRVVEYLRSSGQLDNTFILFVSDNGAAADQTLNWGWYPWAERVFDLRPENMGRRGSYVWLGPGWAHVSATPWRLGKGFPTRGGTLVPAIVFDAQRVRPGSISHSRATMLDVVPTVLEMAGLTHPSPVWRGRRISPLEGHSLLPLLADPTRTLHDVREVTVREIWNRRSVQQGDWKIVWMNRPWGRGFGSWSLFNVRSDPTELVDVADRYPVRVAQLVAHWEDYVQRTGAIVIDDYDVPLDNLFTHYEWLPPTLRDTPPGSFVTPPWIPAPTP
jgi:arylsulfatase